MRIGDPDWLNTLVSFKRANVSNQAGWAIRYTPSGFLFAEGPSGTGAAGREIFEMLAGNRQQFIDDEGNVYVRPMITEE